MLVIISYKICAEIVDESNILVYGAESASYSVGTVRLCIKLRGSRLRVERLAGGAGRAGEAGEA